MRLSLHISLLLFIIISCNSNLPGQVELSVEISDKKQNNLLVYSFSDLITWHMTGDSDVVIRTGTPLIISSGMENPGYVILRYGAKEFFIIAEPGSRSGVILPPIQELTTADRNNPYFTYPRIHLECSGTNDINNSIRRIDSVYSRFTRLITNDIYWGVKKKSYDSLVTEFSGIIENTNHGYYNNWAYSRFYSLKHLSERTQESVKECMAYLELSFDSNNPASVALTNELFNGILTRMLSGDSGNDIRLMVSRGYDFISLADTLALEIGTENRNLAEFILLDNLFREYWGKSFKRESVYNLIRLAVTDAKSVSVREAAKKIISDIDRLKKGNLPPVIELSDDRGVMFTGDSLTGKYTILSFAGSSSWQSISELKLLRSWIEPYIGDVRIVTILVDDDFESAAERMRDNGFNWVLLDGSKNRKLKEAYDIRFVPTFFLLDRKGRIISAPAPFPSETLKDLLNRQLQNDFIQNVRN